MIEISLRFAPEGPIDNKSTMVLLNYGIVMPYGDIELGNIGSGNGLVPDGTKPLPVPMLPFYLCGFVAFAWEKFHSECLTLPVLLFHIYV